MNGERYQHLSLPRHCLDRYPSFVRKTHHSDHVLAMLMMRNPWLLEGSKCLPSPGAYFFFLLLPSLPGRKNQQSSSIADCLRLMWS